jgi:GNAT superfamily N-acetyltransferase
MTFTIRPFTPTHDEYEAIHLIEKAVFPENADSVEDFKHDDATRNPDHFYQRLVVEQDSRLIAFANMSHPPHATNPGLYRLGIIVHPDFERRGVGTAVYNQLWQTLQTCKPTPTLLAGGCYQHHKQSVRFLEKRGFKPVMRWVITKLDVPTFNAVAFAPLRQKLEAQGIAFRTVPQLQISNPEWMAKLHELDWQLMQDEPLPYTPKKTSLDEFKKMYLDAPNAMISSWVVAVDNGRYVGNSLLEKGSLPGVVSTGFTGVLGDYRRRGLATALKAHTIQFAQAAGYHTIRTGNEENNPMLTLNKKLGFTELTASLAFEKQVG